MKKLLLTMSGLLMAGCASSPPPPVADRAVTASAVAAPVVRLASSQCLTSPRVAKRGVFERGLSLRPGPGETLDLREATIRGQASASDALTVTTIRGFNNVCVLGGRHIGRQDPQRVPWVDGHKTYGAGILFQGGTGAIVVEQAVIANSLQDGITLAGGLPKDTTFGLRSSWIRNTSDDGIQNDGGKKILFIEDTLIEAKMGLSQRPGADAPSGAFDAHTIPIRNTLWNILCVADDRPDGSDSRNPGKARTNNCGPSRSASQLFKWSGGASKVKVDMADSIVRFEARSRNGWGAMEWPAGTYRNVIVVWDPVTPGMKYQGPALPAGVTLTTDTSVWTKAKAGWLEAHGCSEDGICTWKTEPPPPSSPPPCEPALAEAGVSAALDAARAAGATIGAAAMRPALTAYECAR